LFALFLKDRETMRRAIAFVLLVVGVFFLCLAPLLRWYTYPRVLKAPLDIYETDEAVGTGTYFSTEVLKEVGPTRLQNLQTYRGNVKAGNHDVAVYDAFSTTKDLGNDGVIDASTERLAFDRQSGQSVHCCGEHPRHVGLTLKFPFGTRKTTYLFWDSTAGRAFPATYVSTTTLGGLKVYVFKQHIGPTLLGSLQVSGTMAGEPDVANVNAFIRYTALTTLWVEPVTGAIVKGSQSAQRLLVTGDGSTILTIAHTDLAANPRTVDRTARRVENSVAQLNLVHDYLPVGGSVLGVVCLIVGGLLLRRRPASSEEGVRTRESSAQLA